MKFGLNWKGMVGIFVILVILLVVLLFIKTGRKETTEEIPEIKDRENAEELVQKETEDKSLREEEDRILKAARRDFEKLKQGEAEEEDLRKAVERAIKKTGENQAK